MHAAEGHSFTSSPVEPNHITCLCARSCPCSCGANHTTLSMRGLLLHLHLWSPITQPCPCSCALPHFPSSLTHEASRKPATASATVAGAGETALAPPQVPHQGADKLIAVFLLTLQLLRQRRWGS